MKEIVVKKTLIDLTNDLKAILREVEDNGGEITAEIEEKLNSLNLSVSQKIDAYYIVNQHLEARSEFFKRLEDQAKKARKSIETHQDSLKSRITKSMLELGQKELSGDSVRYVMTPCKPKLVIDDESKLPGEYTMVVTTTEPDKEKIKQTLELFGDVPGARLEGGFSLRTYMNKGE
jgi:hypothetical protein